MKDDILAKTERRELVENETAAGERQPEEREEEARPDQPDEAERWRMLQMVDENGRIPERALLNAWEHARQMPFESSAWPVQNQKSKRNADGTSVDNIAGITPTGWTWLGPGNIGGRIRSIVISPADPNMMWVGSVGGGIWKTTNGGANWAPLNDFMANLAVSCMAIDPTNPQVLYAGTGEGYTNADSVRGAGIFKSTDGGASWAQLPSTSSSVWYYVNRIAISPADSQIILAATSTGIYRSMDGGATWSQKTTTRVLDIDFNPSDGTKAIASGFFGLALYSTDGGSTWNPATGFTGYRVEVAYSRSNPAIVYASVDVRSGEVYRSSDGGQTYTLVSKGRNYLGDQGWYDNSIWVDPTNPNMVIVGGIDLWRGTYDGTNLTLTKISDWQSAPASSHADNHIIVESPAFNGQANTTVFFGNDGGIYRASNVYTVGTPYQISGWTSLNNNLGITQFYGGAGNSTSGRIIGGTQDNGTLRYTGSTSPWDMPASGDGGFCAADPTNPNYFYGEYTYLRIHRSTNGGVSSNYIYSGIADAGQSGNANFIAPFTIDPNNPNTMLAGGTSLWRSTNVKAQTPTWKSIKASDGDSISTIAVAYGNSDIIWVGDVYGDIFYTTNGTSDAPTWTRADLASNLPNRYCERIVIDPTNSSRVYVTFGGFSSGNVSRTDNSGATWTNISGNLPAAPVYAFAVWQQNPNYLYAGTEVGIFASADGGQTWSTSNDGPTNCSVAELFWMNNTLVAVTHGRGMFSILLVGGQLDQTLTFGALSNRTFGEAPFTVNSTASSGLPVNFTLLSGPATISGNIVTIKGAGTVAIRASQAGDITYRAATPVDQSFIVAKAVPVITWNNPANIAAGTPLSATQLNATANVPGTFLYTPATGTVPGVGTIQLSVTFTPTDTANYATATKSVQLTVEPPPPPTLSLSSNVYTAGEAAGKVTVTVNRAGDTAPPVTVTYATGDMAGLTPCGTINGVASSRCDYATTVGTLQFATGETSKTISIPIVDDGYTEGPENFSITLSNVMGGGLGSNTTATITITDNDTTTSNPIATAAFFVRQQYIDFLGREPDPGGYAAWQNILNTCAAGDVSCDRIAVSSGFFRSPEFQARGYFIYRFYSAALGRKPTYAEFMPDLAKVSGFLSDAQLEANKVAFVQEFMTRTEFANRYGSLSNGAFVDMLIQTAGLQSHPSRNTWVDQLNNGSMTRAQVLRQFTESTEVYQKFYNEAFVVMQYFGYLRRDPDASYVQWIQTMNANSADYRTMINGFINSNEYVLRFGP